MDLELRGKTALVCGASKGLGYAIAECLAEEGVFVGLLARNSATLASAAEKIVAKGGKSMSLQGDIGDWVRTEAALKDWRNTVGDTDILVINSGGPPAADVTKIDPDLWRAQFEAMVLNQMRLVEALLPGMRAKRFGRILSVSSTSIIEPFATLAISNSLRAALAGWLKTLAGRVAAEGITVNLLLPGSFATERIDHLDRESAQREGVSIAQVQAANIQDIPAKRYGEPKEFGTLAAFLASPKAAYITGTALRIDGGATRSL
jgi:3-oxoacyl-[acyl-carrier protein] reductase